MQSKYLYLLLDLGSFIVPFIFSFYPKANFSRQWKFVLPAIAISGILFLIWDEIFTQHGVWGFNEQYTTGVYIGSLPLEEVLFFICIPYACYFTYFALNHLIKKNVFGAAARAITISLIILSVVIAATSVTRLYTAITFSLLALLLAYWAIARKTEQLGRFYLSFSLLLIPFFIVNGILTGTGLTEPVVWYNNSETLGIRIGTIPLEDAFYAMLLMLTIVTIADKLAQAKK